MIPQLLTCLLLVPLFGSFAIPLCPEKSARKMAIALGLVMVALSLWLAVGFDPSQTGMQFEQQVSWITSPFPIEYHVGIDGMSLCLVLLTTGVTLMAILASGSVDQRRPRLYYSMVMLLTTSILGVFVSLDLVQFFVLYELELIPMFLLIAIWGGPRRDYAAWKFLIYTFFGGVLMLGALLYLYLGLGDLGPNYQTFDMVKLSTLAPRLVLSVQTIACLGFMLAFLIKLPSFPFHTWLPDAHVEAPTPISMILAGLLLKMGSYGLFRICLGFFPDAIVSLSVILIAVGAFNIVWAAIACLVQDDMKRIIAFSSISHMGFVTMGLGALSAAAFNGAIFQMISHGVISAALFFLVGTVYDRCHTRNIAEIGGGLAKQTPYIFYFWMLAALANLGLPGLSGFVAEVTVYYGSFVSPVAHAYSANSAFVQGCIIVAGTGVILTAGYMLWLLKRLFFGPMPPKWAGTFTDITQTEAVVAACLSFFMLALGIYPMWLTNEYTPLADQMSGKVTVKTTIGSRL